MKSLLIILIAANIIGKHSILNVGLARNRNFEAPQLELDRAGVRVLRLRFPRACPNMLAIHSLLEGNEKLSKIKLFSLQQTIDGSWTRVLILCVWWSTAFLGTGHRPNEEAYSLFRCFSILPLAYRGNLQFSWGGTRADFHSSVYAHMPINTLFYGNHGQYRADGLLRRTAWTRLTTFSWSSSDCPY